MTPQPHKGDQKQKGDDAQKIPPQDDALRRIQELEKELLLCQEERDRFQKELEAAKDQAIRSLADAQNMRRRSEEERGKLLFESTKGILMAILPSLENFDLAIKNIPKELENNEWVEGILAIEKHLADLLKKEGVEQIDQMGTELDPHLHEAVVVDPSGEKGKVISILQKGFLFHGKVLWPAKVAVGGKEVI